MDCIIKRQRNSSLELLRIISMFFIICHHYSVHGGFDALTYNSISLGRVWIQLLSTFGKVPCSVFAMISGFCMVSSKERKNHYRKIVPLGAEMTFYSVCIFVFAYITKIYPVSLRDGVKALLSVISGNWFVVGYLCLYALVPFLNPFLTSLPKNQYRLLLFVFITTYSFIPTFLGTQNYGVLGFFVVLYSLGAYVKLYYNNDFAYENNRNLLWGLVFAFLIVLSTITLDVMGYFLKSDLFIEYSTYFASLHSILAVFCAFFIFVYFSNLEFYNQSINLIASATLGVYLIHDNYIMSPIIWTVISPNVNYVESPYIHSIIKITCVFIICVAIELIRAFTVGKWFDTWFYSHADSMWKKITEIIQHFKENTCE